MNNVLTLQGLETPHGVTRKITRYELQDVLRSRWIALYALFFLGLSEALLRFGGGPTSAMIGLANVALLVIPLVGLVFGAMYLYSARDFIELLLSQPVDRRQLFQGLYGGLALPLALAFVAGSAVPFLFRGMWGVDASAFAMLLVVGTLLTWIFLGLAFVISLFTDERVRGLAIALGLWLTFALIYDGLVLVILHAAADYPLEGAALAMMMLNPVDLGRTLLLMQFDLAAMMGYTGALFERFFGSVWGLAASFSLLLAWSAIPFAAGLRRFQRKDF